MWEGYGDNHAQDKQTRGIPGQSCQTVLLKPLCGTFNQNKYLSLRFTPIIIDMSFVDDFLEHIISTLGVYVGGAPANGFYKCQYIYYSADPECASEV